MLLIHKLFEIHSEAERISGLLTSSGVSKIYAAFFFDGFLQHVYQYKNQMVDMGFDEDELEEISFLEEFEETADAILELIK